MKFLANAGFLLFLLCLAGGLYALVGSLTWPAYFPVLQLHVWCGLLLTTLAAPALAAHLRLTGSRPTPPLLIAGGLTFGLWLVAEGIQPLGFAFEEFRALSLATAASAAQLLVTGIFCALLPGMRNPTPTRWSGVVLTVISLLSLNLGIAGWWIRGDERWGAIAAHSGLGLLAGAAILPHIRKVRARLLGPEAAQPRTRARIPARRWAFAAVVVIGLTTALMAAWTRSYQAEHFAGFDPGLIPERWEVITLPVEREQRLDQNHPRLEQDSLEGSLSCGEAGCHEALTEQWAGSAHRFSADNDLFLASVRKMVEERGPEDAAWCGSCHDPARVAAGTFAAAYADGDPPPGEGVSCLACHSAYDLPHEPGNGRVALRQPQGYPGDTRAEVERNIRLDPRFHRQENVAKDFTNSGNLCGTCHRIIVDADIGAPATNELQNPYLPGMYNLTEGRVAFSRTETVAQRPLECVDCHMPTTTEASDGGQPLYDHYFVGRNEDLAHYARAGEGDQAALALVAQRAREFLDGTIPDNDEEEDGYYPEDTHGRTFAALRGAPSMTLRAEAERSEDTLKLVVWTGNPRAGHPIPIGPFDLQEVWLEVTVRTVDGEPVAASGQLTDEGWVPDGVPRLGATEWGSDELPLRHHRIWDLAEVRDKRLVSPGEELEDTVQFALEPDTAGPLVASLRWNFRRANPRFTDWVYGPGEGRFPVRTAAAVEIEIP